MYEFDVRKNDITSNNFVIVTQKINLKHNSHAKKSGASNDTKQMPDDVPFRTLSVVAEDVPENEAGSFSLKQNHSLLMNRLIQHRHDSRKPKVESVEELQEFKEDEQDQLFETSKFSFSDKIKAMDDFDNVIVPRSKKIAGPSKGKTKWSMSTTDGKSSDQSANPHLFNFHSDSSNKSHVDAADLKLMHHKFDNTLLKCYGEMQVVMRISENSLMLEKFLKMFRGLAEKIKISLD
jgi:hypothetical protein